MKTATKPTVIIETVTPQIAAEYLKLNHAKQRNMTSSHMLHLSQQMKAGQWKMNGESIIFDHDGNILDGQHRMYAVIDSGLPSEFVIVRGIDPDCFPTIDRGKPRSNGNTFAIAGIANYNIAASATAGVINYRRALSAPIKDKGLVIGYGGSLNTHLKASTTDMLEEYYSHEGAYVKAINISLACKLKAPPSCVSTAAALALIDGSCGDDWVGSFWQGVASGVGLTIKSPILKLRERLEKNLASKAKLNQNQLIILMVKAWNLYAQEKECGVLRVDSSNAVPVK